MIRACFRLNVFIAFLLPALLHGQSKGQIQGKVANPAFDQSIASMLNFSAPIRSVSQVKSMDHIIYLDAREPAEYNISHIPGAVHIGYDHWDSQVVRSMPKDQPLVVYCSVGYRSEKIADKLIKLGYLKVYNLYGSIFEWANEGNPLQNNKGELTRKLHTYSKKWSKWVDNPEIEKIW